MIYMFDEIFHFKQNCLVIYNHYFDFWRIWQVSKTQTNMDEQGNFKSPIALLKRQLSMEPHLQHLVQVSFIYNWFYYDYFLNKDIQIIIVKKRKPCNNVIE